ncbi:MAG: cysteine hydrolase [Bacteroidales bacterium]|nr:cysteine hydrolase [Bacteroidales bacterium]
MKKFIFSLLVALATVTGSAQSKTKVAETALIIIDMQNDFVDPKGVLCVAGAAATIPAIADLADYGRSKGWQIVHIVREHRPNGLDVDEPRVPLFVDGKPGYCVPGTWGCEIVPGIPVKEGDMRVVKFRNSAFFQTQLDLILRRMGVKTVVLAGTQYPNCVRGTANDAMSLNYETVVCTDACSAKTPAVAEANVFDMRNMGIKCISLAEVKSKY